MKRGMAAASGVVTEGRKDETTDHRASLLTHLSASSRERPAHRRHRSRHSQSEAPAPRKTGWTLFPLVSGIAERGVEVVPQETR